MDCFLWTNVKVNSLSAKECSLKLKIDTQQQHHLCMNLLIILQVESDRLICASVNPNGIVHCFIIAYYIICIPWKWFHIKNKNCTGIVWYSTCFYCWKIIILFQTFIFKQCIFIYIYSSFLIVFFTIQIILRFYANKRGIYFS